MSVNQAVVWSLSQSHHLLLCFFPGFNLQGGNRDPENAVTCPGSYRTSEGQDLNLGDLDFRWQIPSLRGPCSQQHTSALVVCSGGRRWVVRPWGGNGKWREKSSCLLSELLLPCLPATLSSYSVMDCLLFLTERTAARNTRVQERGAGAASGAGRVGVCALARVLVSRLGVSSAPRCWRTEGSILSHLQLSQLLLPEEGCLGGAGKRHGRSVSPPCPVSWGSRNNIQIPFTWGSGDPT